MPKSPKYLVISLIKTSSPGNKLIGVPQCYNSVFANSISFSRC